MRPMRLELQAFSAYATRQIVDFRDLGTHTLMMISGKTGAGKTALLDAICYALFGQSSGGDRQESSVRSHHAQEKTLTYVDFRFETQSKSYKVLRYPPQKGKGTGQVEFWRVQSPDDSEGELIASGKRDVGHEVKALLGYTVDQFRSVVMLPQGQFRRFLSAKTDSKAELLSTLFHTERYRRLQDALNRRALDLKAAQTKTHEGIAQCLQVAGVPDEESLKLQIQELKHKLASVEPTLQALQKAEQSTRKALETGQRMTERLNERQALLNAKDHHSAQETSIAQRRDTVRAARLAAQMHGQANALSVRGGELKLAQTSLKSAQETLSSSQDHLSSAQESLRAEHAQAEQRTLATHRAQQLDGLRPLLDTLKELAASIETGDVHLREHQKKEQEGLHQRETLAKEMADLDATLNAARIQSEGAAKAELDLKEASSLLRRSKERFDAIQHLDTLTSKTERLAEEREVRAAELAHARETHAQLYERHLACYASQLASALDTDRPCPVCGSKEHPQPAVSSEEDPGKEAVHAAARAVDAAVKEEQKAASAHRKATEEHARKVAEVSVLTDALGAFSEHSLEALNDHLEASQARLTQIQTALKVVQAKSAELERCQTQSLEQDRHLKALAVQIGEHQKASAIMQERMKERLKQLPEGVTNTPELEDMIREAVIQRDQLLKRFVDAQEAEKAALSAHMQAQTAVSERQGLLHTAQEALDTAESVFLAALKQAQFEDIEAYQAACLPEEQMRVLVQSITEYDEEKARLAGRLEQLNTELKSVSQPDLNALETAQEEAHSALQEALENKASLREQLSPMEQATQRIGELRSESADREREYGLMTTLSQVANGDQPNAFKLKFDRYILAGLLDEVLIHANQRLRGMSDGRYHLQRKDPSRRRRTEYKHDRRSQAGLALEVVDAYTGKERDAESLSGGEGFQASLSLALGLADVVQRQSGGVELNAMFIDEGFGTQSPDALDSVLDTLTGLQTTGRLIGFISHVSELKGRIPAELHVHKTSTGSRVELRVR